MSCYCGLVMTLFLISMILGESLPIFAPWFLYLQTQKGELIFKFLWSFPCLCLSFCIYCWMTFLSRGIIYFSIEVELITLSYKSLKQLLVIRVGRQLIRHCFVSLPLIPLLSVICLYIWSSKLLWSPLEEEEGGALSFWLLIFILIN